MEREVKIRVELFISLFQSDMCVLYVAMATECRLYLTENCTFTFYACFFNVSQKLKTMYL